MLLAYILAGVAVKYLTFIIYADAALFVISTYANTAFTGNTMSYPTDIHVRAVLVIPRFVALTPYSLGAINAMKSLKASCTLFRYIFYAKSVGLRLMLYTFLILGLLVLGLTTIRTYLVLFFYDLLLFTLTLDRLDFNLLGIDYARLLISIILCYYILIIYINCVYIICHYASVYKRYKCLSGKKLVW